MNIADLRAVSASQTGPAGASIRVSASISGLSMIPSSGCCWTNRSNTLGFRSAPVAGGRHVGGERGERGGLGAKDAGAERDGVGVPSGSDGGALVVGEAAFGP